MRNIELKAIYPDSDKARRYATEAGAEPRGRLIQTDTYFHTRFGRLKLRETAGEAQAELIAYHRSDRAGARASDYERIPILEPSAARRSLAQTLGIRLIVRKERELWLWRNVRIHLDRVEHLGGFIEFEAVCGEGVGDAEAQAQVEGLMRLFEIAPGDVRPV